MQVPLSGRTAFVTGAAGGIGRVIVDRFRHAGALVIATDMVRPDCGDHAFAADLRDEAALSKGLSGSGQTPPDIVVHAGAASVFGGVADTDPEDFIRLYDINVVSAVRLLRLCLPEMKIGGKGCFIFLSSINADFATPTLAAYAASKGALNNLTKTAALELAPFNIRVNAIAPASVDTPMLRSSFARADDPDDAMLKNIDRHPLGRLGKADDIAEAALFLAADASSWITGTIFPVDGGAHVTRR